MKQQPRLQDLRELFLAAPMPQETLLLAIAIGIGLVGVVLWLVRQRALREEYTPIWVLAAFSVLGISIWPLPISWLTRAIGAWTETSTLFFLALMFLVAICLNYAVRLSRVAAQVKNLSQEIALLRLGLEETE